jgi:phenylpropionate dioxygenase-like ring-hydroxylating dioxygenase large terminal subunit
MDDTLAQPTKIRGVGPGPSYRDIIERDSTPVPDVLAQTANPPQPTTDVPVEHFISQDFFDLEMARMWNRVWQYACRLEHIPETGDYTVYDIGRYSIIVMRTAQDTIKAYVNSCMHRGTKLKPSGTTGWNNEIMCPFHGWTWNLDGTLQDVPCAWEFDHLDYDANRLPEAQVGVWNSFVFINMDPDAMPLVDYLEVLPEHFEQWSFDNWYISGHTVKELHCNWKVALEGFMEAYHTPVVHTEMTHIVGDWNMQHDVFGDHTSRDLCPLAVSSPTSQLGLSEQELLDRSFLGNTEDTGAGTVKVPDGKTARIVMAEQMRANFKAQHDMDLSHLSDAEVIDSLKYNIFPNAIVYGGPGLKQLQLFKPVGMDPDKCTFESINFRPCPPGEERPEPAEPYFLAENESFNSAPTRNEGSGNVLDQDTSIMRWQQEGMHASRKRAQTLSSYQESRIRRIHETLMKYVGD